MGFAKYTRMAYQHPVLNAVKIPSPKNRYWLPKNPDWRQDRPMPIETAVAAKLEDASVAQSRTVPRYYINRNPCNLITSGLNPKRKGFQHDSVLRIAPEVSYHYRLHLSFTNTGITAWVQHTYGKVVVRACTHDRCIAHFLYSKNSVNAARQLGRVMAQRMKHAGIWNVKWTRQGIFRPVNQKVDAFARAITGQGVALGERRNRALDTHEPFRVIYWTERTPGTRRTRPGLRRREIPEVQAAESAV